MSKSTTTVRPAARSAHKSAARKSAKAKTKKFARAFGNDQKNRTVNASAEFRKAFRHGKAVKKSVAVATLLRKGLKPATIASFIVWAKRDTAGTPNHFNPWGFMLVESVDAKGNKTLTRAELPAAQAEAAKAA
jgi:hypothetical protein